MSFRYVQHYNQHRPHRSLAHATPVPSDRAEARNAPNLGRLRRRDVLGGLIHEYKYEHDTRLLAPHAKRRYQWTATTMTSGGNRKPAKSDRGTGAGRGRRVLMRPVSLLRSGRSERNSALQAHSSALERWVARRHPCEDSQEDVRCSAPSRSWRRRFNVALQRSGLGSSVMAIVMCSTSTLMSKGAPVAGWSGVRSVAGDA